MNPLVPFVAKAAEDDYVSNITRITDLIVRDFAGFSINILELLSVLIIVWTTLAAFFQLIRGVPYARVYLLHGQSIGLTFKLGSEILRTITARSIMDIWEVFLLIVIKALMVWLIEWELKSVNKFEDEKTHPGQIQESKPHTSPFYFMGTHIHQGTDSDEIKTLKQKIAQLESELHPDQKNQTSPEPDQSAASGENAEKTE